MTMLVIDIGNTSTSIGYCRNGKVTGVGTCTSHFNDAAAVIPLITARPVDRAVIAPVVPPVKSRWEKEL